MQMNDTLKAIEVHNILGRQCWDTKGVAKAVGVHRNTVLKWIRKTAEGKLDFPFMRAPVKNSDVYIPIDDFLEWYGYTQN